jgi:hypothetical protein
VLENEILADRSAKDSGEYPKERPIRRPAKSVADDQTGYIIGAIYRE